MASNGIKYLDVLHADIQGAESAMLHGAAESFAAGLIGYVFLSTHSNELHAHCEQQLRDYKLKVLYSLNLAQSYSDDGLIVACSDKAPNIPSLRISARPDDSRAGAA